MGASGDFRSSKSVSRELWNLATLPLRSAEHGVRVNFGPTAGAVKLSGSQMRKNWNKWLARRATDPSGTAPIEDQKSLGPRANQLNPFPERLERRYLWLGLAPRTRIDVPSVGFGYAALRAGW
jgi:hypothetical protein